MLKKLSAILTAVFLITSLSACQGNNDQAADYPQINPVRDTSPIVPMNYDRDQLNTDHNLAGNNDGKHDEEQVNKTKSRGEISSTNTTLSSKKFPHTKAVVIQEAKYKSIPVDKEELQHDIEELIKKGFSEAQINAWKRQITQGQQGATPDQQQQVPQQQPEKQQPAQPNEQIQEPEEAAPPPSEPPAPAPNQQQEDTGQKANAPAGISKFAQQVIDLTNKERTNNGLKPLTADAELSGVAYQKSVDMQENNYFSHTSPKYGSPFDMMRDFGIEYNTAGENIAQGQRTPEEVVQAWMNSPGHRANILSEKFTHIGVGFEETGYHWTQMFIGK